MNRFYCTLIGFVIPAKAGSRGPRAKICPFDPWTPAFAGVTDASKALRNEIESPEVR